MDLGVPGSGTAECGPDRGQQPAECGAEIRLERPGQAQGWVGAAHAGEETHLGEPPGAAQRLAAGRRGSGEGGTTWWARAWGEGVAAGAVLSELTLRSACGRVRLWAASSEVLFVGGRPGFCHRAALAWAETHPACDVLEPWRMPARSAGCVRGSRLSAWVAGNREAERGVGLSASGLTAGPPSSAALPLLLRCPGPSRLGDILPRGAEGHREGLCHLRGPDGEGGAPQLHQQGGEGEGGAPWATGLFLCLPVLPGFLAPPSPPRVPCASPSRSSQRGLDSGLPFCSGGAGVPGPKLCASRGLGRGLMESPSWPGTWWAAGRCGLGRPQRASGGGERWRCRGGCTPCWGGLAWPSVPAGKPVPFRVGIQAWGLGSRLLWESVSIAWEPASPLCGVGTVPPEPTQGLSGPLSQAIPGAWEGGLDASITGLFQELRMEIAKQELIVQAREAASRVLSALSGACGSGPSLRRGAACWGSS